jgi:hypothetical protein
MLPVYHAVNVVGVVVVVFGIAAFADAVVLVGVVVIESSNAKDNNYDTNDINSMINGKHQQALQKNNQQQ